MSRFAARVLPRLITVVCVGLLCVPVAGVAGADPAGSSYGQIVVVAGTGEEGYSGDGQRAVDARISERGTIDVGPDGTLYLVDEEARRIRAVNQAGVIQTVPGTRALRSPENDGPMVGGWQFSPSDGPRAAAVGKDGALYIAGRETIRRIGRDGSSTTLAELYEGPIRSPEDIAVDGGGTVYVSGDGKIHKIDPAGKITTIGGGGTLDPLRADGKPATEARLGLGLVRIAADARGTVYLVASPVSSSDGERFTLHRIDPDGTLHTIAGGEEPGFAGDGGPAAKARLSSSLGGVAVGTEGTLYLHDLHNGVVRTIHPDGTISTLAPPVPDRKGQPDLAVGPGGDVYVRIGMRVYLLPRNGSRPAPEPAREASYPARFPPGEPGTVHTVAGSGSSERPDPTPEPRPGTRRLRVATGPDGSYYYSDAARHRVMKIAADGTSSVLAGTGNKGFDGDGGPAARATLHTPAGLDVGPDGAVYLADSGNNRLRKIDSAGVITTIAGNGKQGDKGGMFGEAVTVHGDGGPATAATVTPVDIALGPDGSLYLAEGENKRIRRVHPDGTISTMAGAGKRWRNEADGHPAAEASLFRPTAVAVNRTGAVYLLDDDVEGVKPAVRMIDTTGILRTVAGSSYRGAEEAGFGGDGGPAAKSELNNPYDIATGPDGTLYIADTYNARIRAVDAKGTITTVAGTGQRADSGDGAPATAAALHEPQSITVDRNGAIHTVNLPGDRIRKISNGTVSTVATLPSTDDPTDQPATGAALYPKALAIDHDGRVLIAEQFAGLHAVEPNGSLRRPYATIPELSRPTAVTVGPDGARYVASGEIVYRVPTTGAPVAIAGGGPGGPGRPDRVEPGRPATLAGLSQITDLAVSATGRLHIATNDGVYRLTDENTLAAALTTADITGDRRGGNLWITGITVDAEDRLYVAVPAANRVYRVSTSGERTTFAGSGGYLDDDRGDGGDATEAALYSPSDIAVDPAGNTYISGFDGIRRVDPTGTITTILDNPYVNNSRSTLGAITLDRHGDLYYIDHNQVKLLTQPAAIPSHNPFPWPTLLWTTAATLTLLIAAWLPLRLRRRRRTPEHPTPDNPPTSAPAD